MGGEEIQGGHTGQVRRLRGVILKGEEIEGRHYIFILQDYDIVTNTNDCVNLRPGPGMVDQPL